MALKVVRTSFGFHLRECMGSSSPNPPTVCVSEFGHCNKEIYISKHVKSCPFFTEGIIIETRLNAGLALRRWADLL